MRKFAMTGVIVGMVIHIGACSSDGEEAEEKITFGVLVPLTGALADFAIGLETASLLAVQEINAAGGVIEFDLAIDVRDSQRDDTIVAQEANALIEDVGVPVITGLLATPDADIVAPIAASAGVTAIVGGASHVTIDASAHQGYLFRAVPALQLEAELLAKHIHGKGHRKLAVLASSENGYTNLFGSLVEAEFAALNGATAARVDHDYQPEASENYDYQGKLDEVFAQSPDAIFLMTYTQDGVEFLQAWGGLGGSFAGEWYLPDTLRLATVADTVSAAIVEGIHGVAFLPASGAGFDHFKAGYESLSDGAAPTLRSWNQYDALHVAALAVVAAGESSGDAIRDNLRAVSGPPGMQFGPGQFAEAADALRNGEEIDYEGAGSNMNFGPNGILEAPVELWKFEGGEPVTVEFL